ncbi:MAG: hypothetical protein HEQ23_03795 [Tepidisphaera sp.]|jgi:hypothetical protein
MFAKLVVVIFVCCGTACGLLALRQSRLAVTHELAKVQLSVRGLDERLLAVRADIGQFVTPERVGTMVAGKAELRPLIMNPGTKDGEKPAPTLPNLYVQSGSATVPASHTPSTR